MKRFFWIAEEASKSSCVKLLFLHFDPARQKYSDIANNTKITLCKTKSISLIIDSLSGPIIQPEILKSQVNSGRPTPVRLADSCCQPNCSGQLTHGACL